MKNLSWIIYVVLIFLGIAVGFAIARNSGTPGQAAQVAKDKIDIPEEPEAAPADTVIAEEVAKEEETPASPASPAAPVQEQPREAAPPAVPATLPSDASCFPNEKEASLQLTLFAEEKEKEELMYNNREPEKLLDCSGIFHRVVRFVSSKCEEYDYPTPETARDSRSLAAWYHEKGNLVLINDPKEQRNLIRPGAVMFFGKSGKSYSNLTVDRLTASYPNGIIEHIGVVTEVKRDNAGNVIGYVMFHGRRPGVTAQRSHYHALEPPRLGFPPFGNWSQQWVAAAFIMTPRAS